MDETECSLMPQSRRENAPPSPLGGAAHGTNGLRAAAAAFLAGLVLIACQAPAPTGIPATDAHKALFAGTYSRNIAGGAEVYMHVTQGLEYDIKQPLAEYKVKAMKGTLSVTGDKTARAGRVKLEWISRNTVRMKSPFGTSMTSGGTGGSVQGQWGAEYTLRRR